MKNHPSPSYLRQLILLLVPVMAYFSLETITATLAGNGLPLRLWYFGLTVLLTVGATGLLLLLSGLLERFQPYSGWGFLLATVVAFTLKTAAVSSLNPALILLVFAAPLGVIGSTMSSRLDTTASRLTVLSLSLLSLVVSSDLLAVIPGPETPTGVLVLTGIGVTLILVARLLEIGFSGLAALSGRWISLIGLVVLAGLVGAQIAWRTTREDVHWKHTGYYSGTVSDVSVASGKSVDELPNIILISLDTLNRSQVSDPDSSLENFRALKQDSLGFTRAFSTTNWTGPSHASLFTGLPPIGHGLVNFTQSRIYSPITSYVQYLRKAGYQTAGFPASSSLHEAYGFQRGFQVYDRYNNSIYEETVPGAVELTAGLLRPTRYTIDVGLFVKKHDEYLRYFDHTIDRALRWTRNRNENRPFFLFLHSFQIHDYKKGYPKSLKRMRTEHPELNQTTLMTERVHKRLKGKNLDRFLTRTPRLQRELLELNTDWLGGTNLPFEPYEILTEKKNQAAVQRIKATSEKQRAGLRKLYRYGIEDVDKHLGELMRKLKARNLYNDSIIVLLSDHGESFSLDPLVLGHGVSPLPNQNARLGDTLTQVPLWVKLPDQAQSNRTYNKMTQITDVFPALFGYLNLRIHDQRKINPNRRALDNPAEAPGRETVLGSLKTGRKQPLRFFVRSAFYRVTALSDGSETVWWQLSGNSRERRVEPQMVPEGVRTTMLERLNRRIERYKKGPDPFRNNLEADREKLESELKGLGYL